MTIAKLKESRRYWFGGEGNDNDPKAQTEDLGDDAMKAGSYGIKNLKRIIKHLPEWNYEEGDMDENVRSAYRSLVQQMSRYANHVAANIGGGYHDFKRVEQPRSLMSGDSSAYRRTTSSALPTAYWTS